MTAIWDSKNGYYTFQSTDKSVTASTVTGINYTAALAFETDSGKTYLVGNGGVLQPFTLPVSLVGGSAVGSGSTVNVANYPANQSVSGSVNILNYPSVQTNGGTGAIVSASFTGNGTATLHAINSFVAPAAGGLTELPNSFRTGTSSAYLTDIGVSCSASGVVITPRVHIFNGSSVTTAVDAGSWIELFADRTSRMGYFTMPAMTTAAGSSTNCSRSITTDTTTNSARPMFMVTPANNSTSLWYGIETTTSFTPSASLIWNVSVRLDQN